MSVRCIGVMILALIVAVVAVAGIVVCPSCGYEINEGGAACAHCGVEVRAAENEPGAVRDGGGTDVIQTGEPFCLPVAVVMHEVAQGRKLMQKGDVAVAALFFRNAAALERLTDPVGAEKRAGKIVELLRECHVGARSVRIKCDMCRGTGKRVFTPSSLTGVETPRATYGLPCRRCSGSGYVSSVGTVNEQKYKLGRAGRRYSTLQQAEKYVLVGGAWVPAGVESSISLGQRADLCINTAAPCEECAGIGREDCRACNGTGLVPCSNRKCSDGMVALKQDSRAVRVRVSQRVKCSTCGGSGRAGCKKCIGRGSVVCGECGGTGERPSCKKCGGLGIVRCRRCKSVGVYKGSRCVECAGNGECLCSACNGDGRKR